MSNYRRTDYGYDDYYGGGERWDRDRFERVQARSRGPRGSSESFRFEEDDRYSDRRGSGRRDLKVEVMEDDRRRGYDDRYYDDYRPSGPRYRSDNYEDDRYRVSGREVAPYRPQYDREYERRPPDRRSMPRYEDERDVNVSVNVRSPSPPPPPREYNYDPPRREYYDDEEYEDVRIRREKERTVYHRDNPPDQYREPQSPSNFKRGRTRMPKRLVHRSALIQKGYPFEEESDFYVVQIALSKDRIDEVIKISESYFHEEKLSVKIEEKKSLPAPESETNHSHDSNDGSNEEGRETEVVETVTTKVIENPTEQDLEKYDHIGEEGSSSSSEEEEPEPQKSEHHSHHSRHTSHHSKSRSGHSKDHRSSHRGRSDSRVEDYEIVEEKSSNADNAVIVLPDRSSNRRNSGQRDVVRVEKDENDRGKFIAPRSPEVERSRSRRRRPNQKVVNAALFSLT